LKGSINSIQAIKEAGGWRVTSVMVQAESATAPLPKEYLSSKRCLPTSGIVRRRYDNRANNAVGEFPVARQNAWVPSGPSEEVKRDA
jgi:hypothetical protein